MNKQARHSRTTARAGVDGSRVFGRQIWHRRIVLEIVVAVRDQWLATTHLGYTSLMRALIATLTALMLFVIAPTSSAELKPLSEVLSDENSEAIAVYAFTRCGGALHSVSSGSS